MSDVQHTHEINTLETFLSIRFANSSGIILLPTGPHAVKCFCLFGLHMASYGHWGGGTLEPSNLEANPLPPPPYKPNVNLSLSKPNFMTLQMAKILHQMNNLTFKNAFHREKVLKMQLYLVFLHLNI